jgi:hypothetical protein
MSEELGILIYFSVLGIGIGLLFVLPVVLKRFVKGEPLFYKQTERTPHYILVIGTCLCGFAAVASFYMGMPYFGLAGALFLLLYLIGLVRSIKKQQSETTVSDRAAE